MTLQELLISRGIDINRAKLVRHNITNEYVSKNLALGYLDIYQRIQRPMRFSGCDYIISFLGTEGTESKLYGCYKVEEYIPLQRADIPSDFVATEETYTTDGNVLWNLTRTELLADLNERLVVDWGKGAINWCQNGTTKKEVLYISPKVSELEFVSYEKVLLTFEQLEHIIKHPKEHKEWQIRLSAVAGLYLITDTTTGKLYVGSASGEKGGGIWQRWSEYVHTKHGNNKRLIELMNIDPLYYKNFCYSILEVFPLKRDANEILFYEQLYKQKMLTIQFGLNDN